MHQVVLSIVAEGCHFQGIALGPGSGQGKGPEDPAHIDEWYREGKLSYYERQERIICRGRTCTDRMHETEPDRTEPSRDTQKESPNSEAARRGR